MGLPQSEYRLATIRMPSSPLLLELLELKGRGPARATRSRVQDPGSFRLQLNVRDIDAALAGMTAAGSTVVSSNRAPVSMTFGSPAVASGGRARSQQPVPGRAAAAAARRPAGRATHRPRAGESPAPAGARALRRQVLRVVPQLPHAHARIWRSTRWTSRTSPRDAAVWEKVIQKVRAGAMPPQGMPQPDAPARAALVSFLETAIDRAGGRQPQPGPAGAAPAEPRRVPERHPRSAGARRRRRVAAARRRLELRLRQRGRRAGRVAGAARALHRRRREDQRDWRSAIPPAPPTDKTYRVRFDLTQTGHIDGLPLGTRGGTLIRDTFPLDGEYVIKPKLWRTNVGFIRGLAYPHQVEISVDGERVHLVTVGTPEDYQTSLMGPDNAVKIIEARMQVRVPIKAGPARDRRDLRAEDGRAAADAAAAVSLDAGSGGLRRRAALRGGDDQRPVQGRPGPATRRAAAGSSRAVPAARRARAAAETAVRRGRSSRRWRGAPIAGRSTDADVTPLLAFYQTGRAQGRLRRRHPAGAAAHPVRSRVRVPRRARPAAAGAAAGVSHQRPRAGVAAVVLPLEQHSRRRAADGGGAGPAQGAGGARAAGAADAGRPARGGARSATSPGSGCTCATCGTSCPSKDQFPDFDDNLRQALQRETELLLEQRHARGPQRAGAADGRLHVRQRAAGAALRHPQRLRHAVPPRAGDRATRAAGCWATAAS